MCFLPFDPLVLIPIALFFGVFLVLLIIYYVFMVRTIDQRHLELPFGDN